MESNEGMWPEKRRGCDPDDVYRQLQTRSRYKHSAQKCLDRGGGRKEHLQDSEGLFFVAIILLFH